MIEAPKLLVEWSSPWEEFRSALGPAMRRSPQPLAGEAATGLFPYRQMATSLLLEAGLLMAAIVLPQKLARMQPYLPPPTPKYDVIYFSGDELPQAEDAAGSQAGRSGRAGGHQAHHRTQVIRVARGEMLREKVVDAPHLHLPSSDSAVANLLAYRPIPGPAPSEGLKSSLRTASLPETAIAPTPEIQRDRMRAAPALSAEVIAPSPSTPQRDVASIRVPGSQAIAVVPPPVSAPEQIANSHPRLTLPAAVVVAPPPTQVARDLRSTGPGFGGGELQKQIVPPPAQMADVTPQHRAFNGLGASSIVPPPVQVNGSSSGGRTVAALDPPSVVPPPVQVSADAGSGHRTSSGGLGAAAAVVPPPPSLSADNSLSGLGHGNRGSGLGAPGDAGALAAPPSKAGGSGSGTGVVVSSQPGSQIGVPGNSGPGSLALAPNGGTAPGLGGSGGGAGIVRGSGPGSGLSGDSSGATKAGTGRGADVVAHNGISPLPGAGGAGTGSASKPPMAGVSVQGGTNIITLPSFGADGSQPSGGGRSLVAKNQGGPDLTIVGTSRSGGAFNFYGMLKGDKVYTIYIPTVLGTAVMQYADPASATHPYAEDLTAPQAMRADLPEGLKPSRLVIACVLDRSGALKNPQVLEPGNRDMTTRVLAALTSWKFRPVFRGDRPVEVNAILGFDIDTR